MPRVVEIAVDRRAEHDSLVSRIEIAEGLLIAAMAVHDFPSSEQCTHAIETILPGAIPRADGLLHGRHQHIPITGLLDPHILKSRLSGLEAL